MLQGRLRLVHGLLECSGGIARVTMSIAVSFKIPWAAASVANDVPPAGAASIGLDAGAAQGDGVRERHVSVKAFDEHRIVGSGAVDEA